MSLPFTAYHGFIICSTCVSQPPFRCCTVILLIWECMMLDDVDVLSIKTVSCWFVSASSVIVLGDLRLASCNYAILKLFFLCSSSKIYVRRIFVLKPIYVVLAYLIWLFCKLKPTLVGIFCFGRLKGEWECWLCKPCHW